MIEFTRESGHQLCRWFYIDAVVEVAGLILVIGPGNPAAEYAPVTPHYAVTTRVGLIDPETLAFRGYLTGFEPGLQVRSALDVDGTAWLFNELSHIEERSARADVYVFDPRSMEVVDSLNLDHPFPVWAERSDSWIVYVFHNAIFRGYLNYRSGITRLNSATGDESFVAATDMPGHHPGDWQPRQS